MSVLRPLGDRVVVSPIEAESESPGGIVIPDVARDKPTKGRVLAVGPGRTLENGDREEMQVAEGDVVLFTRYGGTQIEVDGKDLVILNESDLLAKLE